MARRSSRPGLAVGVGLVYVAFAAFATWVQHLSYGGQVFWPAAGVTVAALLLTERRAWPGILLAVGAAEIVWDLHNNTPVLVSLGWGLSNTAEPLFSALMLARRGKSRPDLRRPGDLVTFLLIAVLAGPALGGVLGGAFAVVGYGGAASSTMLGWGIGDALGVLVIAPILLTWRSRPVLTGTNQRIEAVVLGGLLVVVAVAVLQPYTAGWAIGLPYLLAPFFAWAGLRFEVRGAALVICLVALAENAATGAGVGVFAVTLGSDGHVVLQIFLAVSAVTALVLASVSSELADRRASELTLTKLALYDNLTGLANRLLLEDRVGQALAAIGRHGGSVGVVYIDLDGFKAVNDTLGHQAGDELLVETARRLTAIARSEDTVARVGGDEFVLLLGQVTSEEETLRIAERVREGLSGTWQRPRHGHGRIIAASLGCASTDLAHQPVADLIASADAAMYREKHAVRQFVAGAASRTD